MARPPHKMDPSERGRRMPALLASPVLTLADTALFLDLPTSTLDQLRQEGKGPRMFKLGRRLYVAWPDLRAWLEERAKGAA